MGGPDSSSDAKSSGDDEREAENVSLVGESLYSLFRECVSSKSVCVGRLRTALETMFLFLWSGHRSGSTRIGIFKFRTGDGSGNESRGRRRCLFLCM